MSTYFVHVDNIIDNMSRYAQSPLSVQPLHNLSTRILLKTCTVDLSTAGGARCLLCPLRVRLFRVDGALAVRTQSSCTCDENRSSLLRPQNTKPKEQKRRQQYEESSKNLRISDCALLLRDLYGGRLGAWHDARHRKSMIMSRNKQARRPRLFRSARKPSHRTVSVLEVQAQRYIPAAFVVTRQLEPLPGAVMELGGRGCRPLHDGGLRHAFAPMLPRGCRRSALRCSTRRRRLGAAASHAEIKRQI